MKKQLSRLNFTRQLTKLNPTATIEFNDNLASKKQEFIAKGFTQLYEWSDREYILLINPLTTQKVRLYYYGMVDGPY